MASNNGIKWIAVEGDAEVDHEEIRFDPARSWLPQAQAGGAPAPETPAYTPVPSCTLASSKYFQRGRISFEVELGDEKCRCQIVLNFRLQTYIVVGLNVLAASRAWRNIQRPLKRSRTFGKLADSVSHFQNRFVLAVDPFFDASVVLASVTDVGVG